MTSRVRLLTSGAVFVFALTTSASGSWAIAAPAVSMGLCFSDLYGGNPGHDFGQEGMCYFCAPNVCHLGTWPGSCSTHHFVCEDTR